MKNSNKIKDLQEQIVKDFRNHSEDALLVFDCDGTLIEGDIGTLTAFAILTNFTHRGEHIPKEWSHENIQGMSFFDFLKMREEWVATSGHEDVFDWESFSFSGHKWEDIYPVLLEQLGEAVDEDELEFRKSFEPFYQKFSSKSWIVSGSPRPAVCCIADMISIPQSQVIASQIKIDAQGFFTKEFAPPGLIWEKRKIEAYRTHTDKPIFLAAGDTYGDRFLLDEATHYAWVVQKKHRKVDLKLESFLFEKVKKFSSKKDLAEGVYLFEDQNNPQKQWILELEA